MTTPPSSAFRPYHVAGIGAVLSSVYSGRRVVQLANFSPEAWIEIARTEKITTAFVVPTMLAPHRPRARRAGKRPHAASSVALLRRRQDAGWR